MAEEKSRIYENGNYGFMVATLNEVEGTYEAAETIEGLVNVDITMSQTSSDIAADDITDYATLIGSVKGEGTITFVGLKKADYEKLYNAITDNNGAIVFGKKAPPKKVGISFFNTQNHSSGNSENKFTLNNCVFSVPNIQTQTVQEDDSTIRSFALSVKCNPYYYTDSEGNRQRITASLLNSEEDKVIYKTAKNEIYIPDKDYASSLL